MGGCGFAMTFCQTSSWQMSFLFDIGCWFIKYEME